MDTHPTEFSESFPMNINMTGFWMFFKNLCTLVLRTEVASGSEGLDNNVHVCYSIQFIYSGFVFSAVVRCVFWVPVGCNRMTQMMRMMMSGSGRPGLLSVSIHSRVCMHIKFFASINQKRFNSSKRFGVISQPHLCIVESKINGCHFCYYTLGFKTCLSNKSVWLCHGHLIELVTN